MIGRTTPAEREPQSVSVFRPASRDRHSSEAIRVVGVSVGGGLGVARVLAYAARATVVVNRRAGGDRDEGLEPSRVAITRSDAPPEIRTRGTSVRGSYVWPLHQRSRVLPVGFEPTSRARKARMIAVWRDVRYTKEADADEGN